MDPIPQMKVPETQLCAGFVRAIMGLPGMFGQTLRSPFGDLHQPLLCLCYTWSCWETANIHCKAASAAFLTLPRYSAALKDTQPWWLSSTSSQLLPSDGVPVLPWLSSPPVLSSSHSLFHHLVLLFLFPQTDISLSASVFCPWATKMRPPALLSC